MAERLVNVAQMARDLQRAREDNAYLRALLQQLNTDVDDSALTIPPPPPSSQPQQRPRNAQPNTSTQVVDAEQQAEDARRFDRALARRQARVDGANDSSGSLAAKMELKSAEDRIAALEQQLLNAEETICHLKAEKLTALRDVERLSMQAQCGDQYSAGATSRTQQKPSKTSTVKVEQLERTLKELRQAHALELEQRLAVIGDQEREIKTLKADLTERSQQLEELQQRHMDLLDPGQGPPSGTLKRVTSGINQLSIIGEDSEGEEEEERKVQRKTPEAPPSWKEELVRHPTPRFDLDSPEVTYLLHAWTANVKKMQYMRRWLTQVVSTRGPLPADFPLGVELPRLPPEVRDGFLTLVVPLLRKQTQRDIAAHSRRYNDGFHTDLRLRVIPRE